MASIHDVLKSKKARLDTSLEALDATSATLPLESIQGRAGGDTRPLSPEHINDLVESIGLLGLVEPLVVDNQNRLLAGGHRKAAIAQLREQFPEAYDKHFANGVPIHRLSFDSVEKPELALQIEITENERRRDYTPAQVRAIADRFKDAGYGVKGRPGKGQAPLIPALMAVVGKSRTTVKRYLRERPEESSPSGPLSEPKPEPKVDYDASLRQCQRELTRWLQKPRKSKREREAVEQLKAALGAIDELLGEE